MFNVILILALMFAYSSSSIAISFVSKERSKQLASQFGVQVEPEAIDWVDKKVIHVRDFSISKRTTVYLGVSAVWSRLNHWRTFQSFYDVLFRESFFKKKYPYFIKPKEGPFIALLRKNEKITDIKYYRDLRGKTVGEVYGYPGDLRKMEEVGGEGARLTIIVQGDHLSENFRGQYNVFFHEIAHLLHQSLMTPSEFIELETLYVLAKEKRIIFDDYYANNSSEYFASGVEAYLSESKERETYPSYQYTKKLLEEKDPELFKFIKKIFSGS